MVNYEDLLKSWGGIIFLGLTNILTLVGTYKTIKANAKKAEAEARKIDAEASTEIVKANVSGADFERALNERALSVMDTLKAQVDHLKTLVEYQSTQLTAQSTQLSKQSLQIELMEAEIHNLRAALDSRTSDLQAARALFPPICRRCEFFIGDLKGCDRAQAGLKCKYEQNKKLLTQTCPELKSTDTDLP